jgi:hypothetical protein
MALLDDIVKGGWGPGVAIGLGAIILGPAAFTIIGGLVRPVAKAAIKGGLILYNQGKGIVAETRETMGDLVAESKSEVSRERQKATSTSENVQPVEAKAHESQMETEGGTV